MQQVAQAWLVFELTKSEWYLGLNSIQFNLARVFGPLLAGATLAAWGGAACFGLNGLSFLVVIVALLSMTIRQVKPPQKSLVDELKSGLRYTRGEPTIVALATLGGLTTFLGLPLLTFLPVFAKDIFHGDINRFSHMMAFSGAGAVCGALIVAWLGRFRHMGRVLLVTQAAFGVLVTAFALTRVVWISDVILFCTGAALLMTFSMTASLVQLIVTDELRGRVMSIYMVAFRGGMPLGSLVAGYAASRTRALAVALRFAAGHALLLGCGAALIVLVGWSIPAHVERGGEMLGGALLIVMGVMTLQHLKRHTHDAHQHSHLPAMVGAA